MKTKISCEKCRNKIKHLRKLKRLLKDAFDHLEYCGWGDSWERSCSEDLRKEFVNYFEKSKK